MAFFFLPYKAKTLPLPDNHSRMSQAKEQILDRIRRALADKPAIPETPIKVDYYHRPEQDLLLEFADEFTERLNCELFVCTSESELVDQLGQFITSRNYQAAHAWEVPLRELFSEMPNINWVGHDNNLASIEVGVTLCEALVARTGSIMVSSRQLAGRRLSIYPPHHIVIAHSSQVVSDISDALSFIKKSHKGDLPSMVSFVSGNSRTADIEKTLVNGAHGPKELTLFLIHEDLEN